MGVWLFVLKEQNTGLYPKNDLGSIMNVQADIHDHQVKEYVSSLPDLVPPQAYRYYLHLYHPPLEPPDTMFCKQICIV